MLIAIMAGVIIITYFIADIINQSKIEDLTIEHNVELIDIHSRSENFTDHFLQGSVTLDSARETREVGNYHFDFALLWYNMATATNNNSTIPDCITHCDNAMDNYVTSKEKFINAQPYFSDAAAFTDKPRYIEALNYYVSFTHSGANITVLRYNASLYLKRAAENFSLGNMENVRMLLELFNQTEELYQIELEEYTKNKNQIDGYLFFEEIRENEPQ